MARPAYVCVGARATGDVKQRERTFEGAPSDAKLAMWAQRFNPPLDMVARYFPSRKGWVVIDMREAVSITTARGTGQLYSRWSGIKRLPRIYPTEAAAVMTMMHVLQRATG